tara:strand:- start:5821 stop:6651 length:831 start_codon:yes stop_codon:yes gene_type:complete
MTFFEFINQVIFIIKNLGLSFWVSVIIISPLFMWFEEIVQTIITKFLYVIFVRFPNKYQLIQKLLGFSDADKYAELQRIHEMYENDNTIAEKLKISEDFLDETRGAMFVYNELSDIILGKVLKEGDKKGLEIPFAENKNFDDYYFNYDIIYKQDFNIKELKEINASKILKNSKQGNELFSINKRFSNELLRKKVYREKPLVKLPEKFIDAFKTKMMEVEGHFLENVEMYLFQKKLSFKWKIFKVIIFIPFMFFLSNLLGSLFEFFGINEMIDYLEF